MRVECGGACEVWCVCVECAVCVLSVLCACGVWWCV